MSIPFDPADLTLTQVVQDVLAEWPAPALEGTTHVAVFRRAGTDVETPFDPQTEEPIALVEIDQLDHLDLAPTPGDHVYQAIPVRVSTAVPQPMALTFDTNLADGTTIALPLKGTVDVVIDWGDGTPEQVVQLAGDVYHTYASNGVYDVTILGTLTGFGASYLLNYSNYLVAVSSFGNQLNLADLSNGFSRCSELQSIPAVLPPTVTNLSAAFSRCILLNDPNILSWDVSNVTTFSSMFDQCMSFNQPIGHWDVSSASGWQGLRAMFRSCYVFNQPLTTWDVSGVTRLDEMFSRCWAFDQDLSGWNTSNVTHFNTMFFECYALDRSFSSWDIRAALNPADGSLENMFSFTKMSPENYSSTLVGWAALPDLPTNSRIMGFGLSKYTAAGAVARATLAATGATIIDGGPYTAPPTGLQAEYLGGGEVAVSWNDTDVVVQREVWLPEEGP